MKLLLVLISLAVIYKGVMDSGDPGGFYSSTSVMYAMLLLDYYTDVKKFKNRFLLIARGIMMFLAGLSALGIIGILTITEENGQFFISFSEKMRLTDQGLVNVHWVFLFLAIIAILMTALETVFKISENVDNQQNKKKGRKAG